jgi:hypothetical protein
MDAPKHFYAWGFKSMGHNGIYMDFIPVIFVFALERRQMAQNMGITAAATVVQNPSLATGCGTWKSVSKTAPAGDNLTLDLLTTVPQLTNISNNYGRCDAIMLSSDGTLAGNTLPSTFGTEVSGIKLYAKCGNTLTASTGAACEALTTKDPAGCSECEQYCDEATCAALKTNGVSGDNSLTGPVCYHAASVTRLAANANTNLTVNGKKVPATEGAPDRCYNGNENNCLDNNYPKVDEGGWYIYYTGTGWHSVTLGAGYNACAAPNLTCAIPTGTGVAVGSSIDLSKFLNCGNGKSPVNVTLVSSSPTLNINNPTANTYNNIRVSGTCGTQTFASVSCSGSIAVSTAENVTIGYKDETPGPATLTAGKVYNATIVSKGGSFQCTGGSVNQVIGTWNGQDLIKIDGNNQIKIGGTSGAFPSGTGTLVPNVNTTCQKDW